MPTLKSWRSLSLAAQFAIAGGCVMLLSMALVGRLVVNRIEEGVVRNTALSSAQYIDSIIAPLSQDLADADTLSPGAKRAIDELFNGTLLGERVVSFKLWKPDGLIVEASDPSIVGQRFGISEDLRDALAGEVSASFENLTDEEDQRELALGVPLLEIYTPIREVWSGEVIGAAEFYEVATHLEAELASARQNSWLAVALIFSSIGALLYLIVLGGSRTIDRQRAALTERLQEVQALNDRNRLLRERVQGAAARASAMNDQALRRIGADLHDGPAQLLGYAALRLDSLRETAADAGEVERIERAVKDAIREIRTISRGLSLPDIETRSAKEIVLSVVEAHGARTGAPVAVACDVDPDCALSSAVKICLYRFVQEGLNNAWRYGGAAGQAVNLTCKMGRLRLEVRDAGPGFGSHTLVSEDGGGMGLAGLRDRVESLGGTFSARNRTDGPGAEIIMELEGT
ncbi:MAG: sensor histidine kinase [Albidovulum sp.]